MKISLEWLNQYLDRPATGDEVEALMTAQGLPIEVREARPSSDEMLDVEVTSNRSDCLSHVGVAREVAAGSGRAGKPPEVSISEAPGGQDVSTLTSVTVEAPRLCPLYTARVIRNVKLGPSPAWMVRRLEAIGQRSVNNVVDITNYVLFELGQPLHAFDMDRLAGRRIVVRTARPGENFDAIDGTKHRLSEHMLVIADAEKPVAVAGVTGGLNSEVGPGTRDILLESAMFDPLSTRRTSRALRLASDSSYRFERGVDPAGVELASRRAAQLIVELAGGELVPGEIRVGQDAPEPLVIGMRVSRCQQVLGLSPEKLPADRMIEILQRLGLSPHPDSQRQIIACTVPTFRLDLQREIDLIEEIARLQGLEHIGVQQKMPVIVRPLQPSVQARRRLGEVLVAHGYHETINFSFLAQKHADPFVPPGGEPLLIEDERRKSEPVLRPSLIPSLMICRKANQDVGNANVRLFETASVWAKQGGQVVERRKLALLADVTGDAEEAVRSLRGTIEELVGALAGSVRVEMAPTDRSSFAAAAEVWRDDVSLGVAGLIASAVQKSFDLQTAVVAAELDLEELLAPFPPKRVVTPLARFPGIERDLSVVIDEAVTWNQVRSQALATSPALLEELRFLVTYRGKPIPAGKKSVSFRMVFRDPAATLRHEQVDPQVGAVVDRLKREVGAELRA